MATRKTKETVEKKAPAKKVVAKKTATKKTTAPSAKDIANAKGEPWVSVLSVDLDPDNIGNGAFELDWNDKFITQLVRAGYQSKPNEPEDVIIDRWFQTICKNIAMENYEQWEANQPYAERPRVINRRDVGDGRTEVS